MNIGKSIILIIGILIIPVALAVAQTEITGFFDVVHTYHLSDQQTNGFQINQFEIDISRAYKSHISFGAAIAYNNSSRTMDLSMAFLHYNIFSEEVKHPRRTEKEEHAGIVLGKFDVPIGLDYLSYASPDRPVVSQPLIIEKTIAGWNDVGVNFHLNKKFYRVNFSVINGFRNGVNLVGDFSAKVFPAFRVGVFHTSDFTGKFVRQSWISGAYVLAEWKIWELKSEYLQAKGIYEGEQDTLNTSHRHHGFYVQLLTDFGKSTGWMPFFFTLRYSLWLDENKNTTAMTPKNIRRYVLGLGYQLDGDISVRLEYLREIPQEEKQSNRLTVQLVVGF